MIIQYMMLLTAGVSACFDLAIARIPNAVLFASLAAGAVMRIGQAAGIPAAGAAAVLFPADADAGAASLIDGAAGMAVPVLLLAVFWHNRMIGAGDIKLLAVIGFYAGLRGILWITFWSFAAAAVISAGILWANGNWAERFGYFLKYIRSAIRGEREAPYRTVARGGALRPDCEMHFAVAVLMEVMMYAGGARP